MFRKGPRDHTSRAYLAEPGGEPKCGFFVVQQRGARRSLRLSSPGSGWPPPARQARHASPPPAWRHPNCAMPTASTSSRWPTIRSSPTRAVRRACRPQRPAGANTVNPNSAHVRRYAQFLDGRHAEALAAAGAPADAKFYDYRYSVQRLRRHADRRQVPGCAAAAERAGGQPGRAAAADDRQHAGVPRAHAARAASGPSRRQGNAGEDVIIGVIDTGIWPEHPSFSDQTDLGVRPGQQRQAPARYGPPPADWHGTCQAGEQWSQNDCNNKLIGARCFSRGLDPSRHRPGRLRVAARPRRPRHPHRVDRGRQRRASTRAIFGRDLGVGTISGMAPRARIAAYKGCFGEAGCVVERPRRGDRHGGRRRRRRHQLLDRFRHARRCSAPTPSRSCSPRDAGVFVATSAGNAGPGAAHRRVAGVAPWVTAVGASTHSRVLPRTRSPSATAPPSTAAASTPGVEPRRHGRRRGRRRRELRRRRSRPGARSRGAIVLCLRETGHPARQPRRWPSPPPAASG